MADFGRFGVWAPSWQWPADPAEVVDAAAELEALGYGSVWVGSNPEPYLGLVEVILGATRRLVVGTSIVDVWRTELPALAAAHARLRPRYAERFYLGLGPGHAPAVEATGQRWEKPLAKLGAALDVLDAAPDPAPPGERMLAALGPRALALAGRRTAGALPFLTPPEHTATAREILGAGPLLIPEQKVYLCADPAVAREIGRQGTTRYLQLPNYLNNLRRHGLTDDDFAGRGSDRLVDMLVGWGDEAAVRGRLQAHLDAGADHVAVHALSAQQSGLPRAEWRAIAEALR
jgi:probable F420-dependent oxidoreductase